MLAVACKAAGDDTIEVRRWAPVIRAGEKLAPLKQSMVIGSVHAYLVPEGASAVVRTVRQGSMTPLVVLSDEQVKVVNLRFRFTGDEVPVDQLQGRQWVYVHANSFGKSELLFSDSTGWSQVMELGMVYRQPQPSGEPISLNAGPGGEPLSFDVDADRNTVWVSVPGLVGDKWEMAEGEDTSFELVRVERLPVPYGDPDRVGLFFVGSRSPRSGVVRIEGGEAPRKIFRFNVQARPSVSC